MPSVLFWECSAGSSDQAERVRISSSPPKIHLGANINFKRVVPALLTEIQLLERGLVAIIGRALEVIEQLAAACDELEQAAT